MYRFGFKLVGSCLWDFFYSICACDFKNSLWGLWPIIPYAEYSGNLPKTVFASRPGFESLIRRLVLGRGSYPNIHTVGGTVTSIMRDANNYSYIKSVSVRTLDACIDIDAALVVDCTGPAAAGLKWLKGAMFSGIEMSAKGLSIDDLKIHYDHKTRYSTLHFNIPDDLGKRLPVPGGWNNAGAIFRLVVILYIDFGELNVIYSCFTGDKVDNKTIYCHRVDGKRSMLS